MGTLPCGQPQEEGGCTPSQTVLGALHTVYLIECGSNIKGKDKNHYTKTLARKPNLFWKHACNPKHSYIKVNFKSLWLRCGLETTRTIWIARHHSFMELKFIRNVCSSCRTLTEQVSRDPRFYCVNQYMQQLFAERLLLL